VAPLREAAGAPAWTAVERWHLTLLFLGAVPPDVVHPLSERIGQAVAGAAPMTLRLAGGGRFGSARRPQVLWVGLTGDVDALTFLAGRLAGDAGALGLTVEARPFRPHLTVGRWRAGRLADPSLADRLDGYRGPEWRVTEVALVRSTLGAHSPHERLAGWPPGG
jgi:2'-5' RNA ligase